MRFPSKSVPRAISTISVLGSKFVPVSSRVICGLPASRGYQNGSCVFNVTDFSGAWEMLPPPELPPPLMLPPEGLFARGFFTPLAVETSLTVRLRLTVTSFAFTFILEILPEPLMSAFASTIMFIDHDSLRNSELRILCCICDMHIFCVILQLNLCGGLDIHVVHRHIDQNGVFHAQIFGNGDGICTAAECFCNELAGRIDLNIGNACLTAQLNLDSLLFNDNSALKLITLSR